MCFESLIKCAVIFRYSNEVTSDKTSINLVRSSLISFPSKLKVMILSDFDCSLTCYLIRLCRGTMLYVLRRVRLESFISLSEISESLIFNPLILKEIVSSLGNLDDNNRIISLLAGGVDSNIIEARKMMLVIDWGSTLNIF